MKLYKEYRTKEEWLQSRSSSIGASEAGVVVGVCKWMNLAELYDLKVDKKVKDLKGNKAVEFGTKAEEHIRALFALDFPQYDVDYHGIRVYRSAYYDFLTATLDGEICDKKTKNHIGILEVKTGSFRGRDDLEQWSGDNIPQQYEAQICHQLYVCSWAQFVIVAYRLKREPFKDTDKGLPEIVSGYKIYNRDDEIVKDNIDFIKTKEVEFWRENVLKRKRPPVVIKVAEL